MAHTISCPTCGQATARAFRFDWATRQLVLPRRTILLTPHEADLVAVFLERPGRVVPLDELTRRLYGVAEPSRGSEVVEVTLCYLRAKLKPDLKIENVRRRGYFLSGPPALCGLSVSAK